MRTTIRVAVVAGVTALAAGAAAALGHKIQGDADLAKLTYGILVACPGAAPLIFDGTGGGEQRLLAGAQAVAPMTRFLSQGQTCRSSQPQRAQGLVVALDTLLVIGDADNSQCSPGGIAYSGCFEVSDRNGVSGVQCTDCATANQYCFSDELDALRVLFAGMHHDAGADAGLRNCNSDVRHSLANNWDAIFDGACAAGACSRLAHAFRLDDSSTVSTTFVALLGLPAASGNAFCNGSQGKDDDPVRRPCRSDDLVCQRDGTSGLVLPVAVPSLALGQEPLAYPTVPCERGRFALAEAETILLPGGATRFNCPERADFSVAGLCLAPRRASGNFDCLSPADNPNVFFPSLSDDARVFNRYVRRSDGRLVKDVQRNRPVTDAWYRTQTAACDAATSEQQVGCLASEYPCSLGVGNRLAPESSPGSGALSIGGISPTESNVRRGMLAPLPSGTYPLSRPIFVNSMIGFENIDVTANVAEDQLSACLFDPTLVDNAAATAGLYSLGRPARCRDFDETSCNGLVLTCDTTADCGAAGTCVGGNPTTPGRDGTCKDRCTGNADCFQGRSCIAGRCDFASNSDTCRVMSISGINFCPVLSFIFVAPLVAPVGSFISVEAGAYDDDDDQVALTWSATAGAFADPLADATSYRCSTPGTHSLTLTYDDGRCRRAETTAVTCVP